MNYESSQLIDQFGPVIKSALQRSFANWQNYHKGRISELESILNSLKILLVHSDEWAKKPDSFWNELETEFAKVRLWTESLKYVSPDDLDHKIVSPLKGEFEKLLGDYPDELRVLIGDTYWQIQEGDSFFHKLRKRYQPLKNSISLGYHNLANKYRDLRHKPPRQQKSPERVIKLHSLLSYYIKNPLIKFMIDEWQRYLQAITGQLFILHLNAKEFANKSLFLEELPEILNPKRKNDIFKNLFELAEVLKVVEENLQALIKYDNQFNDRFDKQWKEISESFLRAWERAGTFQLKNKLYSDQRLSHLEYSIGSRFKKYRTAWKEHFQTFQGEWQKDTEISLLRYKTVKNLYRTASRLHDGFQNEIDPYFLKVKDFLSNASTEIDDVKDEIKFRSLVTSNRKLILHALQELLETIHSVGIVRLLEDSLKSISTAVNNLGEQHQAFVKQDTERRPPRSIIESVPLKELVTDEIFDPFLIKFKETISTTEVNTKHILRVISEIDQIIEFNSDSTLKLMSQSNNWPVIERAKSEMSEGLDRTAKRLTELRKDLALIPEQCSEDMLTNGLVFETELEKFLDSEKLFKFKSQLRRKRFFNGLKQFGSATVNMIISFFPFLYKKLKIFIKNIWRNYFSLKPTIHNYKYGDNEKVKNYLNETETRISKLPFIYQKLFHFQSLNDMRFFTNRYSEINVLKDEFSRWQNGTPSAVAIIGERGSGLTTFLNFIQNEIYMETPATRVIFTKPDYSEDNIRNIICDAFHFKHSQSWEELENKILEESTFKICILENMHFMYLKTASGFGGLEKFLNLLSRTKYSVFWISTCTLYSWQFLQKAIGIDSHFQRLLTLYNITPEELKSIIMKRHRASGFLLEFESTGNPRRKKKSKSIGDNPYQTNLEKIYFEKLHQFAGGNITTAILMWLRSIKEFSKDKMVLSTSFDIDFRFLNSLSEDNVLTLSAILYHEIMSPDSHSEIFNQNMDRSRLQLENLEGEGLLVKNGHGYQIHPFIYRPLVQSLKNKNILS
jgi:hypothetical protein